MANPVLSPRQIVDFARDGYLVVPGYFAGAELAALIRDAEEVQALPEVAGRHMVYYEDSHTVPGARVRQRIENIYPFHDGFHRLFDGPKMRGACAELFGEAAMLYKDKINLKLPGGGGFEVHQDQQAGWSAYADLFITALVSIDPSSEANGCLRLAPGHHQRGLIGREWEPMTEAETAGMDFVSVPTEPGDVIFFDSYAPHGSEPNLTDTPRRILYVTYNRAREGDLRARYFADKRANFPPDCEREPGREYVFRV